MAPAKAIGDIKMRETLMRIAALGQVMMVLGGATIAKTWQFHGACGAAEATCRQEALPRGNGPTRVGDISRTLASAKHLRPTHNVVIHATASTLATRVAMLD
jgi:hypothetical protein